MPLFQYTALSEAGKKTKGDFRASTKAELMDYLRQRKLRPIRVEVAPEKKKQPISLPLQRKGYRLKDIIFFTRQLATMLHAGLNVNAAIGTLSKQKGNKKLSQVLENIHADTTLGISLSESLKKHKQSFPSFLVRMIEVGEISGNLDTIMQKMANFYEREYEISKKVKGALTYPAVVLFVTVLMMVFILLVVLPSFESMFTASGQELPALTRMMLAMSDSLSSHGLIYLILILALSFFIRNFIRSDRGQALSSRFKLSFFLVRRQYTMIVTSRFARTMQVLLYSGIPITQSLEITANIMDNTLLKKQVLKVRDEVNEGETFSRALDQVSVFPDILISMVSIGETSGSLDEMLKKASDYYDSEMERAVDQLIKLIEPASILLVAVLVAIVLFSILLPMLNMINLV